MNNLCKALIRAQKKLKTIKPNERNPVFSSGYASLAQIRNSIVDVLTEEGLVVVQPLKIINDRVVVETQLIHAESGECIVSSVPVVAQNEKNPQQMGSGISYARRYGVMSLLFLTVDGEDDDGNAASGVTANSVTTSDETNKSTSSDNTNEKRNLVRPQGGKFTSFKSSSGKGEL